MNGHRLTVGLIIAFLSTMCFLQSMNLGCSKNDGTELKAADESSGDEAMVFRSSGGTQDIGNWSPVSSFVIAQINNQYKNTGIVVDSIEKSNTAVDSIKCYLAPRDGVSEAKQLMDGLLLLYNNFPNLDDYFVQVGGDAEMSVSTGWKNLVECIEQGYTFERAAEFAAEHLRSLNGNEEDEEAADPEEEPENVSRMGGVESKLSSR